MSNFSFSSSLRLARAVVVNRWMVAAAGFIIMSTAGATYSFGVYSQTMKSSLGYSQKTLNTISTFKDLGSKVGIVPGLMYDFTGPRLVLPVGSLMNVFGYLMIWLAVTKRIAAPAVWQMCLYICLGANSQGFTNTGVVVTVVKNFPHNRGLIIGILKGALGLSGAMLNLLFEAIYDADDPASFILLVAYFPAAVCLLLTVVIRRLPAAAADKAESEKRTHYVFLVVLLALAAYLMVIIVVEHLKGVTLPPLAFKLLATVMALIVLLSTVGIAVQQEVRKLKLTHDEERQSSAGDGTASAAAKAHAGEDEQVAGKDGDAKANQEQAARKADEDECKRAALDVERCASDSPEKKPWTMAALWTRPERGEDYSILQAVFSVDMLLIFVCTICGFGPALTVFDNLGQVGDALGYSNRQVQTFVSLLSVWNSLGRVGTGLASDVLLRRHGVPRTLLFAIVLAIAAIGNLLLAFDAPGALFMGSIFVGFSYGGQLALMYILISELFGLRYYGTLFNMGNMASPLGSYLFSVLLAGQLYDRQAARSQTLLCRGAHCYKLSFAITAAACVFGCAMALLLTLRTRCFYKAMQLQQLQHARKP